LKGCFLVGEGIGSLSTERIHIRLSTLSCVARDGTAVIDQPVKGWVVDEDARVGLKGRVVAKMGVHIARSALTGLIGGIGEGFAQSTRTSAFGLGGSAQSIYTGEGAADVLKSGLGTGIANAAGELQKVYLQLAEQTLPVIECGATKNVTVVISEGVQLKIKEIKLKS